MYQNEAGGLDYGSEANMVVLASIINIIILLEGVVMYQDVAGELDYEGVLKIYCFCL